MVTGRTPIHEAYNHEDGVQANGSSSSVKWENSSKLLLLTAKEAATACRTSLRTWRSWDAALRVPAPVRLGRVKLWRPLELADWVAAGCPARGEWEWEARAT